MCIFAFSFEAHATEALYKTCKLTDAIWDFDIFTTAIEQNNDLTHKTGMPEMASGDMIEIEGNVFDSNCVPVAGAIVEIWQADSVGKLFDQLKIYDMDPHFAYSGRAITDNLGYYHFYTVAPGKISDSSAPFISYRVRHNQFAQFETKMFFPNNNANNSDDLVTSNPSLIAKYSNSSDANVYKFDITLNGVNAYKRF